MPDHATEISALKLAIATGALEVQYAGGRRVRYDSYEKLLARLRFLESQQDPSGAYARAPTAGFAAFDRGER